MVKNRILAVGIFLLGVAAIGRVCLSWVEYSDKQQEKIRQSENSAQSEVTRGLTVQACDSEAEQNAAATYKNKFQGSPDYKEGFHLKDDYEAYYKRCLRSHGIDN